MTIKDEMKKFKTEFEPLFQNAIENIIQEQRSFHPLSVDLDTHITTYIKDYSAGGKRIRPFLISYFAGKDTSHRDIKNICIAVELFHLAALIHDDIMDQATTRRHTETIHIAVKKYEHHNPHLGTDVALLLGDIFLTAALSYAAERSKPIFNTFNQMIQRTIRGQYLDSFGMNQDFGSLSMDEVSARHELKTSYYTFVTPGLIGNMLADDPFDSVALEHELKELGLLFQIRDDIIDCIDANSGKDLYSDIFENQTTWVTLYVKENHPELFQKIVTAKNTHDTKALDDIFINIDLSAEYQYIYKENQERINKVSATTLQEKLSTLLSLLVLKK